MSQPPLYRSPWDSLRSNVEVVISNSLSLLLPGVACVRGNRMLRIL